MTHPILVPAITTEVNVSVPVGQYLVAQGTVPGSATIRQSFLYQLDQTAMRWRGNPCFLSPFPGTSTVYI
jgi:hypothetical protein